MTAQQKGNTVQCEKMGKLGGGQRRGKLRYENWVVRVGLTEKVKSEQSLERADGVRE